MFDCPNVRAGEPAFLMFQSRDVDHPRNVFEVNGIGVFGGLPVSPARDSWNGNVLLVERHHQLRATGNVLRIESRDSAGTASGNVDDFIIDKVVLVYKTPVRARSAAEAPGGPVLTAGVFDQPSDCVARGTDNMQLRFASGLPHDRICGPGDVPIGTSRFIHVEQRRDARRARIDPAATAGRNRDVVMGAIEDTFTFGQAADALAQVARTS